MAAKSQKAKVKEYIVTVKEIRLIVEKVQAERSLRTVPHGSQMIGLRSGSAHMMATP